MRDDGLIRVAAAAAAASGVFAAVTGQGAMALLAGLCAVTCAVLTRRATGAASTASGAPLTQALDLRTEPTPDELESEPTSRVAPMPVETLPQLLDLDYLDSALRGRIAVARRALRPLSVVYIMILGTDERSGPVPAELIAAAATATLRESDIVGRRDDGVYVVVLEDTGEDGAVWTTERLRRHITGTIGPRRFQAGVASYPNHGLDAESVVANAARALRAAQEWDRDRIEVAVH